MGSKYSKEFKTAGTLQFVSALLVIISIAMSVFLKVFKYKVLNVDIEYTLIDILDNLDVLRKMKAISEFNYFMFIAMFSCYCLFGIIMFSFSVVNIIRSDFVQAMVPKLNLFTVGSKISKEDYIKRFDFPRTVVAERILLEDRYRTLSYTYTWIPLVIMFVYLLVELLYVPTALGFIVGLCFLISDVINIVVGRKYNEIRAKLEKDEVQDELKLLELEKTLDEQKEESK